MYIKSYSCKRFAGIKDKDISFEKGISVILGPNEAGKSTIIKSIAGLLKYEGSIKIDSMDNKTLEAKKILSYGNKLK